MVSAKSICPLHVTLVSVTSPSIVPLMGVDNSVDVLVDNEDTGGKCAVPETQTRPVSPTWLPKSSSLAFIQLCCAPKLTVSYWPSKAVPLPPNRRALRQFRIK